MGGVLTSVALVACLRWWRACVDGMLFLLLLVLLKYYPEEKKRECILLKQK